MKTVIELAGFHNAGKTRTMNEIAKILIEKGFRVSKIGERRSIRRKISDQENAIDRQTLMLTETIADLVLALNNPEIDFILVERGPWDSIAFSEGLIRADLVSRQEVKHLLDFAKAKTIDIDLVVLILISEEISIERRKKGYLEDPIVGNGNLCYFEKAYQDLEKKLPAKSIILNGVEDLNKNIEKVAKVLFSQIKRGQNEISNQ